MTRKNKKAKLSDEQPTEGFETAAETAEKPANEIDGGFAFPLEKSPLPPAMSYFCAAPRCPGYGYRASVASHPRETCGNLLNVYDKPENASEKAAIVQDTEHPPAPLTEPENELPELHLEALHSTGFEPSALVAAIEATPLPLVESTDMPQIEPELPPRSEIDDKLDEPIIGLPVVEGMGIHADTPSLGEEKERVEGFLSDENSSPVTTTAEPLPADSIPECYPMVGSYWADTNGGLIEINEYGKNNLVWAISYTVQVDAESGKAPPIRDSVCGFQKEVICELSQFTKTPRENAYSPVDFPIPKWVIDARVERILNEYKRLLDEKEIEAREAAQETQEVPDLPPVVAPEGTTSHPLLSIAAVIHEIAAELNVKPLHVMRFVEGSLQSVGQAITFRELVRTSPILKGFLDSTKAGLETDTGIFPVVREVFGQCTARMVDASVHAHLEQMGATFENQQGLAKQVREALNEWETQRASLEQSIDAIEEMMSSIGESDGAPQASSNGNDLREFEADTNKELDSLGARIAKIEVYQKEILSDLRNLNRGAKLEKHDPKSSKQRGAEFRERERELREEKKRNLAKLRAKDAAERASSAEKSSKGRKSRMTQLPIPGSGLDEPKRGPGRPRTKPIDNRPKRTRGRPPKVQKTQKKPYVTPELRKLTPGQAKVKLIDAFIGEAKDPRIRALLDTIAPSQLDKFLSQCGKGLPDMSLTGWKSTEMGTFAKWYYGRRRR